MHCAMAYTLCPQCPFCRSILRCDVVRPHVMERGSSGKVTGLVAPPRQQMTMRSMAPPPHDSPLGTMIRHPLRPRGTRVRNPCCRWDAGSEPVLHEVMGYHGWGGRRNA